MENSDSDDQENESAALHGSQMDQLAREGAFHRFVNNLSVDDYRLMSDNNLLGNAGESTEEEMLSQLQDIKENPQSPPENSGEGDFSEEVFNSYPTTVWLDHFGQTENIQRREQTGDECWRAVSQSSSNTGNFRSNPEINFNCSENPDPENEYVSSLRYSTGENMENNSQRGLRRPRSRSPEHRRTRVRLERESSVNPTNDVSPRFHQITPSQTFEHLLVHENEFSTIQHDETVIEQITGNDENEFSTIQHDETVIEQITGNDEQSDSLYTTFGVTNHSQDESSQNTTSNDESWSSIQGNPTILSDSGASRVYLQEHWQRNSTAQIPYNIITYEGEQEDAMYILPQTEQSDVRTYINTIGIPIHGTVSSDLSDNTCVTSHGMSRQVITGLDESNDYIYRDVSLQYSDVPPIQNTEYAESENGSDAELYGISHSGSNSNLSVDYSPSRLTVSSSSSTYISGTSSASNYGPSSEVSEMSPEWFDTSTDDSVSSVSSSEVIQEDQYIAPVIEEEDDAWLFPNLAELVQQNESDQDQPRGLTQEQIDSLETRTFLEHDDLKSCTICITEYIAGTRLRVLPCSHEYHPHCIARWLAENLTCPICRRRVIVSGNRENSEN